MASVLPRKLHDQLNDALCTVTLVSSLCEELLGRLVSEVNQPKKDATGSQHSNAVFQEVRCLFVNLLNDARVSRTLLTSSEDY